MTIGFPLDPALTTPPVRSPWLAGLEAPSLTDQEPATPVPAAAHPSGWATWVEQRLPGHAIVAASGRRWRAARKLTFGEPEQGPHSRG
ncbi:MAG: hypothetical protein AB7S39_12160 [Gemmatimonadales bacterium]